ncbi:oligosaccharide flippase family protein [Rhabdothermincola sediminis]|uniref:oligosaccharide flippase family protein n=1 Tax=Rhabdothermincola sediminis TaxID=2751370 RepID=UPI001AA0A092|nr:oligosaccharide flippase family protein [Rhabdothermincola sediminis]
MDAAENAPAALERPGGGLLRWLTFSRIIDQAALGLASLLLARVLGPDGFALVAVLFIVNSLAVQVSDFGVGFAVYRLAPSRRIARRSLERLRLVDGVLALVAVAGGLGLRSSTGAVIASAGLIWLLSAEAYVRKAAALKLGAVREVVTAEIGGAGLFFAACVAVTITAGAPGWVGVGFVGKHVVECLLVRTWPAMFTAGGERARSRDEWLGQVMTYLVANVDYLLIGWLMGAEVLSVYVIAFRFASAVPAFLATPITQSAFIDFASASPAQRQARYDALLRRIWILGGSGTVLLLVMAPVLPRVLGAAWEETAPVLAILSIAVPWRLLLGTTVAQAITAGRARVVVGWETARLVGTAILVVAGARFGLRTTAACVSLGTVVILTGEHAMSCRLRGVSMPRWLPAVTGAVASTLAAVAVMTAA